MPRHIIEFIQENFEIFIHLSNLFIIFPSFRLLNLPFLNHLFHQQALLIGSSKVLFQKFLLYSLLILRQINRYSIIIFSTPNINAITLSTRSSKRPSISHSTLLPHISHNCIFFNEKRFRIITIDLLTYMSR